MLEPVVSVKWLSENFDDPNLVILDASPKSNKSGLKTEFPGIQIPGARYFDTKHSFCDLDNPIPNMLPDPDAFTLGCRKLGIHNDSKIVVYDNLSIYNSPRVWWMFRAMGHLEIAVLDGGLPAWKKEELPSEPIQQSDYMPGNFSATYQPNLVQNAADIIDNLTHKKAVVLDARSEGRFKGTTPEPRAGLASGHIPDSLSLPYKRVLRDGKFLPKAELKKVFEEFDLGDQPLVFTCGSGITACIILLASELVVDNPKAVYDGSWSEWGQLAGVPVEK